MDQRARNTRLSCPPTLLQLYSCLLCYKICNRISRIIGWIFFHGIKAGRFNSVFFVVFCLELNSTWLITSELAMHYRAISSLEVFRCDKINTTKLKDGLTSFLILDVLEAKIFPYDFLDQHNA